MKVDEKGYALGPSETLISHVAHDTPTGLRVDDLAIDTRHRQTLFSAGIQITGSLSRTSGLVTSGFVA